MARYEADRTLTMVQLADRLGYQTASGAYSWVRTQGCPIVRGGRRLRVYARAVEICLERQREGRRAEQ